MLPRGGKPALDPLAGDIRAAGEHDDLVTAKRVLTRDVRSHQAWAEQDDLHVMAVPLATDRPKRQPAHEVPLHFRVALAGHPDLAGTVH